MTQQQQQQRQLEAQVVRNLLTVWEPRLDPWIGKMPWRREWLSNPVFLPGGLHGQRSLESYIPTDISI